MAEEPMTAEEFMWFLVGAGDRHEKVAAIEVRDKAIRQAQAREDARIALGHAIMPAGAYDSRYVEGWEACYKSIWKQIERRAGLVGEGKGGG